MFSQRLPSSVYAGYGPWKFNEGWVSKHGNQTIRKPTGIGKSGFHLSTEEESLSLKYFDRVVLKSHTYITYHMYTSGFSSLRIFLFFGFLLHVGPSRNPQLPRGGSVLGGGEQWHGGGGAGGGPRNANLFQDSTPGTDWVMASKGQRNPMESPTAWLSIGYWNHTGALTMNGSFQWFQHVPNFQVMITIKRPWVARRFLFTYGYLMIFAFRPRREWCYRGRCVRLLRPQSRCVVLCFLVSDWKQQSCKCKGLQVVPNVIREVVQFHSQDVPKHISQLSQDCSHGRPGRWPVP